MAETEQEIKTTEKTSNKMENFASIFLTFQLFFKQTGHNHFNEHDLPCLLCKHDRKRN